MNFVTFASLLLVFSITVLAFPQGEHNDEINGLPGGFHKRDHNTSEIAELAKAVVAKKFATDSESSCVPRIEKVLEAATKVVAGMITRLKLQICPDTCSNNAVETTDCKVCTVEILDVPWQNIHSQVEKFDCSE